MHESRYCPLYRLRLKPPPAPLRHSAGKPKVWLASLQGLPSGVPEQPPHMRPVFIVSNDARLVGHPLCLIDFEGEAGT